MAFPIVTLTTTPVAADRIASAFPEEVESLYRDD